MKMNQRSDLSHKPSGSSKIARRAKERAAISEERTTFWRSWRNIRPARVAVLSSARLFRIDRSFPSWLRALVRGRESGLLFIAAIIGLASGAIVAGMSAASQKMHEIFFQIPQGASLSVTVVRDHWRVVLIPTLGGLALAALGLWAGDRFRGRLA